MSGFTFPPESASASLLVSRPERVNPRSFLVCIVVAIVAAGCDQTFVPIAPSDRYFSVSGYLDASRDTQWIRVMPIRDVIPTSPGPLGATVTLENIGTGQIVELQDSVFRFSGNPDVGSAGVFLHNFWTTERIEPAATYRFSAKWDAERTAEANVEIPPDYQVEVWLIQSSEGADLLRLTGLRHVAFIDVVTHAYDECGPSVQHISLEVASADSDVQMVPVHKPSVSREGCGTPLIEKQELWIVGSGAAWPSNQAYSAETLGVPDSLSNISHSVGYLGGVLTKLIPYENCRIPYASLRDYCQLRYDAAAATLKGTVTDILCTGEGVAGATVELRELDPVSPALPKSRFTSAGRSGEYEIGALVAGGRYALTVSRFIKADPKDQYEEHTDTLVFASGESLTYDVDLRRLECPSQ